MWASRSADGRSRGSDRGPRCYELSCPRKPSVVLVLRPRFLRPARYGHAAVGDGKPINICLKTELLCFDVRTRKLADGIQCEVPITDIAIAWRCHVECAPPPGDVKQPGRQSFSRSGRGYSEMVRSRRRHHSKTTLRQIFQNSAGFCLTEPTFDVKCRGPIFRRAHQEADCDGGKP